METKKHIAVIEAVFGLHNSKLEVGFINTKIDGIYPIYRIDPNQLPPHHDIRRGTVIRYSAVNTLSKKFVGLEVLGNCIGPDALPDLKQYAKLLK